MPYLPICPYCQSKDIGAEGTFSYDYEAQEWVKEVIYGCDFFCRDCGEEFKTPSRFGGTVIRGTFRPQDLIPAFLDELKREDPAAYQALMATPFPLPPAYAREDEHSPWWSSEECTEFTLHLMDLLNDAAPEGFYFGYHPGNNSDFGYWEKEEISWD